MKTLIIFTAMLLAASTTYAQVDFSQLRFDLGGNYTQYKGDFHQKTAGVKFKASVPLNEKVTTGLSFTYHMPIKIASEVALSGGGSTASEITYSFKSIGLEGGYNFTDENEVGFTPYANFGASFILVNYTFNTIGHLYNSWNTSYLQ